MDTKESSEYQNHGHDGRYSFGGDSRVILPSPILGSADEPFCFWDKFIFVAEVQEDVIISKISAKWFKPRIHLDDSKVDTP